MRRASLHAALAAACCVLALSCEGFTAGSNEAIAVQLVNPPDTILVNDTVVIQVRVLNRSGDSIPGAPVAIHSLAPDTLGVDSARMAIVGLKPGRANFVAVARSSNLPSAPFPVVVK
jgi:hypothetical protein